MMSDSPHPDGQKCNRLFMAQNSRPRPAGIRRRWILVSFLATCAKFAYIYSVPAAWLGPFQNILVVSPPVAREFLTVNVEILVTALTVTLGVTLLGMQFKAQSHTMISLGESLKNKAVYGFVALFLSMIVSSLLIMLADLDYVQSHAVYPLAFGTSASMLYLVLYVYHVTNELQPNVIIKRLVDRMGNDLESGSDGEATTCRLLAKLKDIPSKAIKWLSVPDRKDGDRKSIHFDMWEQVMLSAVERDDNNTFKNGIDGFFGIYQNHLERYMPVNPDDGAVSDRRPKAWDAKADENHDLFIIHLKPVILACIVEERERFMEEISTKLRLSVNTNPDMPLFTDRGDYDDKIGMLRVINDTLHNILVHDKPSMLDAVKDMAEERIRAYRDLFSKLGRGGNNPQYKDLFENPNQGWRLMRHESASVLKYIHTVLGKLVYPAIDRKSDAFLKWYLDIVEEYYVYVLENTKSHYQPLERCVAIINYAMREGDMNLFSRAMSVLFGLLSNPRQDVERRPMFNTCIEADDARLDPTRARADAVARMRGCFSTLMMDVMREAAGRRNAYVLEFFGCYGAISGSSYKPRRIWNYLMLRAVGDLNADMFQSGCEAGGVTVDSVLAERILARLRMNKKPLDSDMVMFEGRIRSNRDDAPPCKKPAMLDDPAMAFVGNRHRS